MQQRWLTVDEYLGALPSDKREALQALREMIKRAAPGAEECISYQVPTFRQDGMLISFGAAARHCALYCGGGSIEAFRDELVGYVTSKGTIRFQPEKPLPEPLVRRIVDMQVAENATKRERRRRGTRRMEA